jgi:parvulin-like peptidyl-prolyl isomerase
MSTKNIILAVLIVAALAVGIWYAVSMTDGQNPFSKDAEAKVVATVNGEEITNADLQAQLEQAKQMVSQQGLDIDEKQLKERVLDQMIGNVLIKQKAKEEGITVKQSEINAEINKVKENLGGEEAFNKQLKNADITMDELEELTREQLLSQEYVESQVAEEELKVSDKEIKNFFNQMMIQQGGEAATDTPSVEEMDEAQKEQIKTQIRQQKRSSKTRELIESLREEAEIEKNL